MKYICGSKISNEKLNIVIIEASSIEDLFWQLDEVGNPFCYLITKRPFKGMISLNFDFSEQDETYVVDEIEDTTSLAFICDDFLNDKNKYKIIKKDRKFSLKRIKNG